MTKCLANICLSMHFLIQSPFLPSGLDQRSRLVLVAALRPPTGPGLSNHCPVPELTQRPFGTPPPHPWVLLSDLNLTLQQNYGHNNKLRVRYFAHTEKWNETNNLLVALGFWITMTHKGTVLMPPLKYSTNNMINSLIQRVYKHSLHQLPQQDLQAWDVSNLVYQKNYLWIN